MKRHQQMKQAIKKIQKPFDQKEIPNERKDIMIRANECSI
jgi:DNA-binding protein YbaB